MNGPCACIDAGALCAAVQALQRHLALVSENQFPHASFLVSVFTSAHSGRQRRARARLFTPSATPAKSASTSAGVLCAENDTRTALSMRSFARPMAESVWLASPLEQAEPLETYTSRASRKCSIVSLRMPGTEKLAMAAGSAFYVDASAPCQGVRLNFSTPSEDAIRRGVDIMARVLRKLFGQSVCSV